MNFSIEQTNVVYRILREAESKISEVTGVHVEVILRELRTLDASPRDVLLIISTALNVPFEWFKNPSRRREYVTLRRLGSYFLKAHYPELTLKQIGEFFDQDHTTVINSLAGARMSIENEDPDFMKSFIIAQSAVTELLSIK